jgi:hypothetical protein
LTLVSTHLSRSLVLTYIEIACSFLFHYLSPLAQGKFVLVVDDEERENEGDLIIAAEKTRTEDMAFLVRYSR